MSRSAFHARRSDVGCQSEHIDPISDLIVTSFTVLARLAGSIARDRRHEQNQNVHLYILKLLEQRNRAPLSSVQRKASVTTNVSRRFGPRRSYERSSASRCKTYANYTDEKTRSDSLLEPLHALLDSSVDMQRYMHAKDKLQRVPA